MVSTNGLICLTLANYSYTEIIEEVKELLRKDYSDDEVEAIVTYLTLVLDRC